MAPVQKAWTYHDTSYCFSIPWKDKWFIQGPGPILHRKFYSGSIDMLCGCPIVFQKPDSRVPSSLWECKAHFGELDSRRRGSLSRFKQRVSMSLAHSHSTLKLLQSCWGYATPRPPQSDKPKCSGSKTKHTQACKDAMQGCHARMPWCHAESTLAAAWGYPVVRRLAIFVVWPAKTRQLRETNKPWLNKLLLWADDSAGIWEHHSWHKSWHQQWPCWLQQIPRLGPGSHDNE